MTPEEAMLLRVGDEVLLTDPEFPARGWVKAVFDYGFVVEWDKVGPGLFPYTDRQRLAPLLRPEPSGGGTL
jgi:hypothetical protein